MVQQSLGAMSARSEEGKLTPFLQSFETEYFVAPSFNASAERRKIGPKLDRRSKRELRPSPGEKKSCSFARCSLRAGSW